MRFMFIVKSASEVAPTTEMMEAMHALARGEVEAGRMIADGGLAAPGKDAALRLTRGKLTLLDGPFTETKEVIGGYAVFELPDHAAAVASATAFMQLHVEHMPGWEGTCEIRQIVGSQVEMIRGLT